jgi:hypothetical protein
MSLGSQTHARVALCPTGHEQYIFGYNFSFFFKTMMDFCLENNAFNLQNITTLGQSSVLRRKCLFFYCIIKYKIVSKNTKL